MSIEAGIRGILIADAALSDLILARVYPVEPPQAPTLPYIVYQRIDGAPLQHHAGSCALTRSRFQFDCFGSTPTQARAVARAVNNALDGYCGAVSGGNIKGATPLDDGTDMSEPELEEFRFKLEYSIWYTED